jgi:hypothetical protein
MLRAKYDDGVYRKLTPRGWMDNTIVAEITRF